MSCSRRQALATLSCAVVAACGGGTPEPQPQVAETPSATPTTTATEVVVAPTAAPPKPYDPDLDAPPDVAKPPANAAVTESGLAYVKLTPGEGKEHPTPADTVTVHYTGWTSDGKRFDTSRTRRNASSFKLSNVIKGWTEGVQLMVVGDKVRFWLPAALAYGDAPDKPELPAGQLTFDVELLEIKKAPTPPPLPNALPAPADVGAPPKDAKKTKSGLAFKVVTKGKGKKHPKATDKVEVHYTGWTTDGRMFDSSVTRGKSATFPLDGVIKGWTEGVQLMVEGEKTLFWIPAELAYGTSTTGGRPSGMLVFEVQLIKIVGP